MSTTFARTHDNFSTSVASPYSAGSGSLSLASGAGTTLGALPSGRVWRFTAGTHFGTRGEVILGVYEATGRTGDTLTGVTASAGYADVDLAAGTAVQIRWTARHAHELQDALNALESDPGVAIGAAVSGGTAGRVLFAAAGPVLADSPNLTYSSGTIAIESDGTHDAQEWKDSGGAVVTRVRADGVIQVKNGASVDVLDAGGTARPAFSCDVANNMQWENATPAGNAYYGLSYPFSTGQVFVQVEGRNYFQLAPDEIALNKKTTSDGFNAAQRLGAITRTWVDATTATRKGRVAIVASDSAGDREGIAIEANGTGADVVIPLANVRNAADDAAAAALSPAVPVGGLYRTGSTLKIRVS